MRSLSCECSLKRISPILLRNSPGYLRFTRQGLPHDKTYLERYRSNMMISVPKQLDTLLGLPKISSDESAHVEKNRHDQRKGAISEVGSRIRISPFFPFAHLSSCHCPGTMRPIHCDGS